MKKQLVIFVMMLIVVIVGFSGCIHQDSSKDTASSDQVKIQTIPPATESLQTILTKAETIESMYYEIAASINMSQFGIQTATIKIWQKAPYLREQITAVVDGVTTTISMIQRPEGTYFYDTTQGKYALRTSAAPLTTPFVMSLQNLDLGLLKDYVNNQTSMNLETETIDGKTVTVIQYTSPLWENLMTIKMWIWNERGVPLKAHIDMTLDENTMSLEFNYSNYSFLDIPDSMFNVL